MSTERAMTGARKEEAMPHQPDDPTCVSAWEQAHRDCEAAIGGWDTPVGTPLWKYIATSLSAFAGISAATYYFWPLY